ncbi:MAG TPA: 3-deoxy-D-manno-octulosonic acid transferase [Pyrinomonadaceae bacterium]|nr:3-deoxy-D-manno-octulosonic acid transferase [Pyrinomonadaceae bacterium]
MYFIYSVLLSIAFLILLPRFLFDALRHGKYVAGFRERLGDVQPIINSHTPLVWIHAVSVGEAQAARPLVRELKTRFPDMALAISTTTRTGQELAHDIFKGDAVSIFYFPFDWRWTVRRVLSAIRPTAVIILETELWPGFLRECRNQAIPVAIVNGRLSGQSFRRYRLAKRFISRVLSCVTLAIMQTDTDANRLIKLGMEPKNVRVSGSLKFDAGVLPATTSATDYFNERFALNSPAPVILAASTHAPEERIILESFKQILTKQPDARLLIAPRHPERFNDVASLIELSGLSYSRRTKPAVVADTTNSVILLDSIGELNSVYSLATIVFVGGSIAKTGGHNILEPAAVGACVVTGGYTHNFQAIVETFAKADALVQLSPMPEAEAREELTTVLDGLLVDHAQRADIGARAKKLVNENRGATQRTVDWLEPVLLSSPDAVNGVSALRVQNASTL